MAARVLSQPVSDTLHVTVQDVVDRALEANPSLQAQQAKAKAKAQLPLQASPAFLPSLSVDLQGMRTTDPVAVFGLKLRQENFTSQDLALDALNRPSPYSGYNATATLQLPILAPEGLFGFSAARKAAQAEEAGAERAAGATRFSAVRAYVNARLAARQVAALDTALTAARAHVRQAEAMRDQGLVTGLDARLADVRASEIEVQRLMAETQARNALSGLKALLDLPDSTELVLTEDLEVIDGSSRCAAANPMSPSMQGAQPTSAAVTGPAETQASAAAALTAPPTPVGITTAVTSADTTGAGACSLEDRGDLRAYSAGVQAASAGVKKAWASQLPALAAFGSLGHYARNAPLTQGSNDWTVGIGLSWKPFQGAAGVGAVRAAKAEREAAEAQKTAAFRQAELEVLQARRMLEAARRRAEVTARAAREARTAVEQAQARYRTGTSPITELLDAQAASTNTTLSELAARGDLLVAYAALDLAYGVFDR